MQNDEKEFARVESHQFVDHGDLPRPATGPCATTWPEICICAAIQLTNGRIFRGHRHDDCIQTALKQKAERTDMRMAEQGFMTSHNRFVGRKEAMQLQVAAGIASRDGYRGEVLFSEDLY